jgi:hypothetical protein
MTLGVIAELLKMPALNLECGEFPPPQYLSGKVEYMAAMMREVHGPMMNGTLQ